MRVGILIVSHSAKLAEGVVELAQQMAPDVELRAAGGTDDGSLGSSVERITNGIQELGPICTGILVLSDLGSATMSAATALEFLDDKYPILLVDGPLVEGAVAGAAVAQGGGSLTAAGEAASWAQHAVAVVLPSEAAAAPAEAGVSLPEPPPAELSGQIVRGTAVLADEMGLHARPAAQLASLAVALDANVNVNGVNAASVIALVTLGASPGGELEIEASGPHAAEAVDKIVRFISSGFKEGA